MPPGLQIDPSSGAISGTVALGAAASGPYSVTVLAQDGTYSTSQVFTWTVTTPITLAQPDDQTNNEGDTVTLSLSATDSGTVFYSALGLPSGLNINPTSGAITGTVAVGDAVDGPYYVTVLAEDGTYSTYQVFTWNINSPVALNIPDDQYNNAGDSVALSLSASNSTTYTPSYSVSGLPAGLSLSSGVISGTLTQGGFWQPTVTVSAGAFSDTESFAWSVANAITLSDPGDQFNNSGDTVSLQLQASDSAPGTLTYSASNLPAGLTLGSSSGLISGTITAATNTSAATTLSITDGTNTLVDFLTWSIGPLSLTSPGNQTNNAGDAVALDLSGFDASGAALLYSASGLPSGLNLNAYTGAVYGTIASSAVSGSPYTVTLQASDGSASASLTFTWTVGAAGTLTLANPGGQANNEGDSVSVALSSTYSGGGTVYYAAYGLPSGLKISPSSGAITGTVALGDAASGPYTVTVVANDGSHSSSQNFAWSISNPITLTLPDDQTNNEGDTVSLGLSGSDASGTLSYAAQDLPPGLAINPSSGAITGTVAVGAAANGPYSVTILATDGTYSSSEVFTWNVNSPVALAIPDDQTNNVGDSVSLTLSATDSSGTPVYSALGLPAGLTLDPGSGAISGTITAGDADLGWFSVTISASDGTYLDSQSFNWYINGVVSLSVPDSEVNTVGDSVNLPIQASTTGSGSLTFTATGLPTGLTIGTSTGVIGGTISASAANLGTFDPIITVTDGTNTQSQAFTWTVNTAGSITLTNPGNQTSTEGASVSLSLSASSGGGTLYYFGVDLPPGLAVNPSSGAITGTIAVGDAADSAYLATVTATNGTTSASETFTWTISNPLSLSLPANQTNNEGDTVALTLTASDSSRTPNFGAEGLPPGLQINTSTGVVSGTIAVSDALNGPYTVTVFANDGTYSASQVFTWTVNGPISLTLPAAPTNLEGDTVSLTLGATDTTSGATLSFAALGLPPGLSIDPSTGTMTGVIAPGAGALGSYDVLVTATDGTSTTSQGFTWTVGSMIQAGQFTAQENTALTVDTASGLLNSSGLNLTVSVVTGPSNGTVTLNPDGSFTYTPDSDYYGSDSFVVQASDGFANSYTVTETVQVQQSLSQTDNSFDAVATADFNGDGNADFVAANYDLGEVYVFLGNGDGTFQQPSTSNGTIISVGAGPKALAVGDLGNGYQDIVVANSIDGTITVLMNNGSGSFTASSPLTVGTDPVSVALGDFLGNGSLDIAVANMGSNTVSIFLNNGSGTFTFDTNLSVGSSPDSVAAGDLNGDTFADLVVADYGSNTISVLLSNGAGNFASAVNYAVGTGPTAVVVANFTGNGILDVAVANGGSNTVSVLLGNGDGTFGTPINYSVGSNPVGLAVGSLDDDGVLDLTVINHGSNDETVLANDGTGVFTISQTIPLGYSPDSVAVADFANNGVLYSIADQAPKPEAEEKVAPVKLKVTMPSDAQNVTLYIDGRPTKQTGPVRQFISPPVVVGKSYSYTLSLSAEIGSAETGKVRVTVFKKVTVVPGQTTTVSMGKREKGDVLLLGFTVGPKPEETQARKEILTFVQGLGKDVVTIGPKKKATGPIQLVEGEEQGPNQIPNPLPGGPEPPQVIMHTKPLPVADLPPAVQRLFNPFGHGVLHSVEGVLDGNAPFAIPVNKDFAENGFIGVGLRLRF